METENEYSLIWGLQNELDRLALSRDSNQINLFHVEAVSIIRRIFGEDSHYEQEINSIYTSYPKVLSPYIIMEPAIWDEFTGKVSNLLKTIEKDYDGTLRQRTHHVDAMNAEHELVSTKLLEFELLGSITLDQKSTLASAISRLLHDAAAKRDALEVLHIQEMEARLDRLPTQMPLSVKISIPTTQLSTKPATNESKPARVFVVHGHDEAMKQAVARIIEKLKLEPIILGEMSNSGRALIEKLDHYSEVDYAVILLSPDDIGYLEEDGPIKAKPRARQNVILELGIFIGKIKRKRIAVLYSVTTEFDFPSDIEGIAYIPYDQYESWKFALTGELKSAGFDVDANKLLSRQ